MDKGLLQSIEIQLAGQAREQLAEFVRGLNPACPSLSTEMVDASGSIEADEQGGQSMQDHRESPEDVAKQSTTHRVSDKVLIEDSKSKIYEKFVRDGRETSTSDLKTKEEQLLEILNEVELPASKSVSSHLQLQNMIIGTPTPQVNVEFDESMLFEFMDECEDESGSQAWSEDENSEQDSEEETQSLKETDPAYFQSIVTKV